MPARSIDCASPMASSSASFVPEPMEKCAVCAASPISTMRSFTQVTFEMVDLETGAIAWSNLYEMKKSAQDDIIYR